MSLTAEELASYITEAMRMSHVYQPVMLRVLLENDGKASIAEIAKDLLSHDRSQVEYYELRTKNMVGRVLTQNGIVEPIKDGRKITGYKLNAQALSQEDTVDLMRLCDQRLNDYLELRGDRIWDHRALADGYVPGSVRYEVLKRAKHRCELCRPHEDHIALQVDHIVPRAQGGSDDISNFQALYMTCNTNKRDGDDTDFRGILQSYAVRDDDCVFCQLSTDRIVAENELCIAIRDGFPVTPMHTLITPKRHVADYLDLYHLNFSSKRTLDLKGLLAPCHRAIGGIRRAWRNLYPYPTRLLVIHHKATVLAYTFVSTLDG